jgi:peptidoglycan hydrolase-like protein with peptidoglycan-binding domain
VSWIDEAAALVREAAPDDSDEILAALTEAVDGVELDDDQVAEAVEAVIESFYEDEAEPAAEAWMEDLHPRAAAGSAGGGEFTSGGSSSSNTKASPAKKTSGTKRKRASYGDNGTLSFDAKSGRGAGYGRKGGDPRVKKLQSALTRLGLTDSRGKKLVLDGKLGPKTTQAIKAAQRRLGLPADGKVTPKLLAKLVAAKSLPKAKAPAKKAPVKGKAREAIDGQRSTGDTREILNRAVTSWAKVQSESPYAYAWVCDFTDAAVVFEWDGKTWQAGYTLTEAGTTGEAQLDQPTEVVAQTWYVPAAGGGPTMPAADEYPVEDDELDATEAVELAEGRALEQTSGRAIEAKGTDADGNRVFRVRIIEAGDSLNGRRYSAKVLHEAAALYDGARSYDHHRTVEELRSGTITGLVGSYRNIEAAADGLYADLHLLPGAKHTAEALDASIAAQDEGLPPLVGISHDAMTRSKASTVGGRRMQEVTAITKVNSADVVAEPAAGGMATRVLAGGIEIDININESKESDVVTTTDVLAALKTATPEDLAAVGLQRSSEAAPAPKPEGLEKASFLGGLMIKEKVTAAGLPAQVVESLAAELPDRITEDVVDARVASLKTAMGMIERTGLAPTVTAQVTQEAFDKKKAALDAFFERDYSKGYHSFKQAYLDMTGYRQTSWDDDLNKRIMRESIGNLYDSGDRSTESMNSTTWNLVLGDSITRRLVAAYAHPSLQTWRQIVSSTIPVSDFRQQRIDRVGGYGTLPTVAQGAPYQPLTSPGNEEITYALAKKGGTEDITFEMIANDDVRAISNIPGKLGLAAARTLHNFVWDFILTNPNCSYDSTALFAAGHGNTTAVALGQSTLSQLRAKMRDQTAYGDTSDILSLVPQTLIVPNELEELGFQLTRSAVAVPSTPAGPSDTPNLHQSMNLIVLDYDTDANDWFLVADPSLCPTIEVGFYNGRQDPELFTQSDPSVGSMFNADTLTYKIRHIYSGAILEHRGFQRGTQ